MEKNETKRADIYRVDPRNIKIKEGFNIRNIDENSEDIEHLVQSILANGVKRPLVIKNNPDKAQDGFDYICIDGHRRLTAIRKLIERGENIAYVKAELVGKMTDEEAILSMFLLNDGQSLSPIEKSEGIKRLHEVYGYSLSEISKMLAESPATISNLYTLSSMPKSIKTRILDNVISPTLALEIARATEDENDFVEKIEELVSKTGVGSNEEEGGKKKKQAKITAKDAKSIVGVKNVVKVLGGVSEKIKDSEKPQTKFFLSLIEFLKSKPAEDEVINWFENWDSEKVE